MSAVDIINTQIGEYENQVPQLDKQLGQLNDAVQKVLQSKLMVQGSIAALKAVLEDVKADMPVELQPPSGGT